MYSCNQFENLQSRQMYLNLVKLDRREDIVLPLRFVLIMAYYSNYYGSTSEFVLTCLSPHVVYFNNSN